MKSIAAHSLPDEEARLVLNTIIKASQSIEKIQDIHDIQIHKTEKEKLFITLHCSFNDEVLLEEVHSLTSQLEGAIYRSLPNAGRVIIHAEPLFA